MTETKSAVYGMHIEIPRDDEKTEGQADNISEILRENGYTVHRVTRLDVKGFPDDDTEY